MRCSVVAEFLALGAILLSLTLVSCKKEGKASSSGGGENGGGDEPELPVDDPVPFSAITILSPDIEGSRYNASSRRFEYAVGETFKLSVSAEPENADDTLTFSTSTSCVKVDEEGNVTCLKKGEGQVKVSSVKNPEISAAINLKVFAKATGIKLSVYEIPGAEVIYYKTRERDSWDIGVGATHKYLVSVEPSDAMQTIKIAGQSAGTGGAKFSISGDTLTVSVPSTQTPPESPGASDKFSYVKIKATDGFVKQFTFYTQKYDPYQAKEGDYIVRYGTDKVGIEDGGYRGNGRYDTKGACVSVGMAYTSGRHSLIMYLGSEDFSREYNANAWDEAYAPKKKITAGGKELHGIAVPLNLNKIYRSDSPDGEIWSDSKSFVGSSGNDDLPHWGRSWTLVWNTDKSYMPHYALFNTCAFVALNAGNGSSYEVRPAQFFVNDVTRKPAIDLAQSNDGNTDFSDDKYWNLSAFQGKLPIVSSDNSACVGPYVTPWLFPMLGDLCCIFAGTEFSNEDFAGTTSLQVETERRLALLKQRTGISDWNLSWWASIEYDKDHAACFTVNESSGASEPMLKWSSNCSKNTKNFVYPILYF